jgi:hypothetical protein
MYWLSTSRSTASNPERELEMEDSGVVQEKVIERKQRPCLIVQTLYSVRGLEKGASQHCHTGSCGWDPIEHTVSLHHAAPDNPHSAPKKHGAFQMHERKKNANVCETRVL